MSCVGNPKEHQITTQNTSETKILRGKRNFSPHGVVTEMLAVNLPTNRARLSPPHCSSNGPYWKAWETVYLVEGCAPADLRSNPSSSTNCKLERDMFLAGFPVCEIELIMLSSRDVMRTKLNNTHKKPRT